LSELEEQIQEVADSDEDEQLRLIVEYSEVQAALEAANLQAATQASLQQPPTKASGAGEGDGASWYLPLCASEYKPPLGINFPTERSLAREARVRTRVELHLMEVRTVLEAERARAGDERERRAQAGRVAAAQAEGRAEEAARLAEARRKVRERIAREAAEARERERERLRLEAERLEKERKERIQQAAAQAEASTAEFLRQNGGQGNDFDNDELRMCRRCRAGPVENEACNDLQMHNGEAGGDLNVCKNCGWFSREWTDWLEWDGVMGPH